MAPIDPNQLLAAFSPLLTCTGGIKNANEVPRLSSLMKKFSRKLVSRCVYCNVLLSTKTDVLEEFLKSGGWETIHSWIKMAKETGNHAFLQELLKLLLIVPMTVERLKENDTPKLIRKISKNVDNSNNLLSMKAKEVVNKWTQLMYQSIEKKDKDKEKDKDKDKDKDHKKKRKKDSNDPTNNDNAHHVKKIKTKTDTNSTNNLIIVNENSDNSSEKFVPKTIDDRDVTNSNTQRLDTVIRAARPATAKVKPGKSRLDGLVNSTNSPRKPKMFGNNSLSHSVVTNKIKSGDTNDNLVIPVSNKPLLSPNNENLTQNNTVLTPPSNLVSNSTSSKKPSTDAKQTIIPQTVTPSAKTYTLQDSTSFMDALIAPPVSLTKKKRRASASTLSKDSKDNNEPTVPKISFYKDTVDEKVDLSPTDNSNDNDSSSDDIKIMDSTAEQTEIPIIPNITDEEMGHINVDINVPDIIVEKSIGFSRQTSVTSVDKYSPQSNKIKSILMLVKKNSQKTVRWVEESKLQQVRYFDLDENERVNVTRPTGTGTFSDLTRSDMKKEAELMQMARRGANLFDIADDYLSRVKSFIPWKLTQCSLPTLVELGKDSREKYVQMERMRTVLESFYTRDQIPESAREPEIESHLADAEAPKVIPLEDENNPNNVHDFSTIDLPQPKTGEVLPSRAPDFGNPSSSSKNFNRHSPSGSNIPSTYQTQSPLLPNFGASQQMMPPFVSGGNMAPMPPPDAFAVRAPQHSSSYFASNGASMAPQWNDATNQAPPHFVPTYPNQAPPVRAPGSMGARPRLPRNAQNTICRHFARTGKCRFQPRCNFLHSQPYEGEKIN